MLLPDIVEIFGAKAFDKQLEISVSITLIVLCAIVFLFAHFFLDENLNRIKTAPIQVSRTNTFSVDSLAADAAKKAR